jgi:hypothetical protein
MIPKKFEMPLFSLILSGLMSLLVSGVTAIRVTVAGADIIGNWLAAWPMAWLFAFPSVMIMAPVARKLVNALIAKNCPRCDQ